MIDILEAEKALNFTFGNKALLQRALTHRSYLNENPDYPLEDNERLEFLGDAVLDFVISNFLPDAPARDSVYLVRRYLRWEKNALLETDEIIARHVF